jgi:hypothetical protein
MRPQQKRRLGRPMLIGLPGFPSGLPRLHGWRLRVMVLLALTVTVPAVAVVTELLD